MNLTELKISKKNIIRILLVLVFIAFILSLNTDTPVVMISSNSMQPALNYGDVVFIKGINSDSLEIEDIILYNCPTKENLCVAENQLIVHRIEKINRDNGIKTKGDANERTDRWLVKFSWIKGKMFFRIPFLGTPIRLLLRQRR